MFSKSTWLHLRIPFSYFLLPIFLFALSLSPNISADSILWTFLIIHFLLYPASNGYNSYFDKDEKSIGLLKNPPPVSKGLYYLALLLDILAIVLGYFKINMDFAVMLLLYGLVSKAYSHPMIRLKKYAITSWFITGVFQGIFSFVMCYIGINKFPIEAAVKPVVLSAGLLSTLMLWGNYPITQVYQHEEDSKRGDITFSILLGIKGTFYFVAAVFALVTAAFVLFFIHYYSTWYAVIFTITVMPMVVYFLAWFWKVYRDEDNADYTRTMWLTTISATCLNAFFIYFFIDSSNIIQAYQ